jgi:type IV pilus assembly protein PilY1
LDRQAPYFSYQNAFYGIKEQVVDFANKDLTLTYVTLADKATSLKNVTGIEIANEDQSAFSALETEIRDNYSGWYFNFSETGERNLGQASLLGEILTFSTYVPDDDLCASEGRSYLYGVHYKTGTGYWKGVLKTDECPNGVEDDKVISKIDIGKGYSTTPNLHTGSEKGSKAFLQTSTGAIIGIKQANPGATKSGGVYWREVLK